MTALPAAGRAERATVREYKKVFRTYPFSDPDPVPNPGRIYPYFRFDGFTDRPVDKEWTVVELENRWIRVTVMPEIGGKVWTAVEKSTGKPFLYGNSVVKFRDIAMRGPWTSGGIEANYGIIGHTPNCATPVDYVLRENPDGSASVVIGVLDLLTRTPWRLEVKVPADKAYFTTTSLWHNQTPLEQPYYTWMNAGYKAAGNLQFVYPGTHEIGHGGEAGPWPIDAKGRDLSYYERNDFGGPKSYHVLGRESDFWGAFWHDDDFGMGRWSPRDEKLGKKIWIWGLSRQGMIWEKLLTDTDGQYVELQSGRSFNQAAEESTRTPFKHRGFVPYGTDTWTEHWFPVVGTKGLVAGSPLGGLNVVVREGGLDVSLSPLEAVSDTLEVLDGDKVVFQADVQAMPLETWTKAVPVTVPRERLRVRIGKRLEWSGAPDAGALSRPLESPADFDWDSVYGLWLSGKEHLRQRAYGPAREALEACLKKDPHYVPALGDLALLRYRAMDYDGALDLARRALAIDTYDPLANYAYGLAAARLGRTADARDGFELAAQSVELRSAAWTELARLAMRGGDFERAASDAERSLDFNFRNLEGHQLLALARRLGGRADEAAASVDALLALDPLSTFGRFEKALASGGDAPRAFAASLQGREAGGGPPRARRLVPRPRPGGGGRARARGRPEERRGSLLARVPEGAPGRTRRRRGPADRRRRLAGPRLPLPRGVGRGARLGLLEERELEAALRPGPRALGRGERGRDAPAPRGVRRDAGLRALLRRARPRPRERLAREGTRRLRARGPPRPGAVALRPRAGRAAAAHRRDRRAGSRRRPPTPRASRTTTSSGMLHARALLANGRAREAATKLARLNVLPYEGAIEGRRLYREAHLMLAVEALKKGDARAARREMDAARLWPENLGAGQPYPENLDERLEDFLAAQGLARRGPSAEANALLQKVAGFTGRQRERGAGTLVHALALKQSGQEADGRKLLADWTARDPGSALAAWANRAYAGAAGPLPAGAGEEARVLAAWLETASR